LPAGAAAGAGVCAGSVVVITAVRPAIIVASTAARIFGKLLIAAA
jgi:hypothetical protein